MPLREAFPIFHTRDIERMVRFYCDRLGFAAGYRFPPEGEAAYQAVSLGPFSLGLAAVRDLEPGGRVTLWLYTDNVDAEIAALREAGVEIIREPADEEWGERMAAVADPDGNEIYIGQRLT